ncbi:SDR family NAD(P)-dependent oxidoreductase [Streptomyces sp. PU-14G]|uniref:SDR family NAD(P)-dependent oxidoreductase n=1 Tax=Streptomyces sp. PU-14G TaxID=2800808 RepID=UPI0034DE71EE
MSIESLSVVVTGAGTGIGRSIALRAARSRARVIAVGRRPEPLKELAAKEPDAIEPLAVDVTDPAAPERIVSAALDRFGRLDAVVNNAGAARFGRLADTDVCELDAMLDVNVRAPAALIRAALPHLDAARGSVVNVTSVAGALAMPGRAYYGASKAALNSLTRSLARELAPAVRVNAVLPGPVDTPLWQGVGMSAGEQQALRDGLLADTPMGRFGEGDEIAGWVCCLIDPDLSGWVTGALLPVDGGRTA